MICSKAGCMHHVPTCTHVVCNQSMSDTPFAMQWLQGLGIQQTLNHFMTVGKVPPRKLSLGLALYGRSWRLNSTASTGIGAKAAKKPAGLKGPCTGTCCSAGPGGSFVSPSERMFQLRKAAAASGGA
jgi:GH18 family chitinase